MAGEHHELFDDIASQAAFFLSKKGIADGEARKVGEELARHILRNWGGLCVYIPKDQPYILSARDEAICQEYDGENLRELAAKHSIGTRRLYQILSTYKAVAKRLKESGRKK